MLYNIFSSPLYFAIFYLICTMKREAGIFRRLRQAFLWWTAILFLFAFDAAPIGFAPVRNFTRQTYDAGSQNWAVAQDAFGRIYIANRDGLLKYDGLRWSLFPLPNYTSVRSVFADNRSGRILVGGSGEFGCFHTSPSTHTFQYESWVGTLPENQRNFTEIWHIHELGDGRFAFQGDYKIFICDGRQSSVITSREKITASGMIGSSLYAGTQSGCILKYRDGKLHQEARLPSPTRIVSLLPLNGGNILIVTASAGLYTYFPSEMDEAAGRMEETGWDISAFLKDNQAFCATFNGSSYAFGTVSNGAVVKNLDTGEDTYINKQTGLLDNTVLGMGFDFSANLWLCLDNGLGYAMVDSPVYNLLGDASESGAGYASILRGNRLFLATNRGLFTTSYPFTGKMAPPVLSKIHSGQVWSLDSIGSDIFVSADDGLFTLGSHDLAVWKMPGIEGGSWYVAPLKSHPGMALASTYGGFYLLSREGGTWRVRGRVSGYDDAGGKFFEDEEGNIWIAHWIKGVYKLTPAPGFGSFARTKLYTSKDGLPSDRDNSLTLSDAGLRIATASGEFYKHNPDGSLSKDERLSRLIPLKFPAHVFTFPTGISLAFSPRLLWKMTRDRNGMISIDSVSLRMVAGSLIPGFEHVGFLDAGNMLVSNQEGFYSINLANHQAPRWKNTVLVETLASGDSVIFSGVQQDEIPELRLPYALNSLTFSFAAPEYRFENGILYSCKLENYDREWSTPSESPSKEYTQLSEGSYTLRVKALNTVTGDTSETSLKFTILAPWYRSFPAKIIYALLLVTLIIVGYTLFRYLSQRNARRMEAQKEAEMEMMRREAEKDAIRKDYEIASLKSEQLELDIKHKSSELSNTTMNVIRKNEILLDISGMLKKLREKAEATGNRDRELEKEMEKIQKLIHDNISHDDDWKKFNQNFDIVYADFTRHLAEKHPSLTVAEKRLCCYLKMGLSSKEIAPIFSISPKSVEMNRYRLRQKLGLERSDNLVEYLQQI